MDAILTYVFVFLVSKEVIREGDISKTQHMPPTKILTHKELKATS